MGFSPDVKKALRYAAQLEQELEQDDKDKIIAKLQAQLSSRNVDLYDANRKVEQLQAQVVDAFKAGYSQGHNDTVEGCYCLDEDLKAEEYITAIKGEGDGLE